MRIATYVLAGLALVLTGCDFEEFAGSNKFKEEFHSSHALDPGGRISVESFNGSVEIVGWDRAEVDISGTKYAATQELMDLLEIDVLPTDDSVRIRAVRPSGRRGNMGVSFVIRAPRQTEIERVDTSNGSITAEMIEGNARLETSNGRVRANGLSGNVEARTSNGSIDLVGCAGDMTLRTSNGSIDVDGARGHIEAETSNGSITARITEANSQRPYRLRTSNGSLNLTLEATPATDVIASTSNSSITVRAPSSLAARVDASTSNGSITTDFDVTVRGGTERKNHLEGIVGAGGPVLDLSTSNGKIRLERLDT